MMTKITRDHSLGERLLAKKSFLMFPIQTPYCYFSSLKENYDQMKGITGGYFKRHNVEFNIKNVQLRSKEYPESATARAYETTTPEALFELALRNDVSTLKIMLEVGVEIDFYHLPDANGNTPLHLACQFGYYEVARIFLKKIENPTKLNSFGETPLHLATKSGNLKLVQYIVENTNTNINSQDFQGNTPLHFALKEGHTSVVQYFLSQGKYLNLKLKNFLGETPLHLAIHSNNLNLISQLTAIDIIYEENNLHQNPLDLAQRVCDPCIVEFLKDVAKYKTVLHYAAKNGKLDILKNSLITSDINLQDNNGNTPLHCAILSNQKEIISFLLQQTTKHISMNFQNSEGNTLLHLAVMNNNLLLAKNMLKKSNLIKLNINGETPMALALKLFGKSSPMYELLHSTLSESGKSHFWQVPFAQSLKFA
jgi:ankyrin repeat protein